MSPGPEATRTPSDGCPAIAGRWEVAVPVDAQWYLVPHTRKGQAHLVKSLGALEPGSCVVLCDAWLLSRSRCRLIASRSAVTVTREYLALPTLRHAIALVQDDRGIAKYFAERLLAARPGSSLRARTEALLVPIVRVVLTSRLRRIAFGRIVLGRVVPERAVLGARA